MDGLNPTDRVKKLLEGDQSVKRSQLRWFGHLIRILLGAFPCRVVVQLVGNSGVDPEVAGGITYIHKKSFQVICFKSKSSQVFYQC